MADHSSVVAPNNSTRLWRSEPMTMIQTFIQRETAHDALTALGKLECLQFIDLNPHTPFHEREFTNMVRHCAELDRQLRFLKREIESSQLVVPFQSEPQPRSIDELSALFTQYESQLTELNTNSGLLSHQYVELAEKRLVLTKGRAFFDDVNPGSIVPDDGVDGAADTVLASPYQDEDVPVPDPVDVGLSRIVGSIETAKIEAFRRLVFRATRGNSFLEGLPLDADLADPITGVPVAKSVFVVFFNGFKVKTDILKICNSLAAKVYDLPEADGLAVALAELDDGIATVTDVLDTTRGQRDDLLGEALHHMDSWALHIAAESAVYQTLNKFSIESDTCVMGEGWVPTDMIDTVAAALRQADLTARADVETVLSVKDTHATPPTMFRTNKFTSSFQNISDSYGYTTYREVNPGLFYTFTYPFLFAVMFGDVLHGAVLLAMGAAMIWKEKFLTKHGVGDTLQMVFDGRYIIFLLGLYSMMVGMVYNEFFGMPLKSIGSPFKFIAGTADPVNIDRNELHFAPPWLGMDFNWRTAETGMTFVNSYKMKISIIIGVIHMYSGIIFSICNFIRTKDWINIFFKAVPEVLFLGATFGYLSICIIVKWTTSSFSHGKGPSLTKILINMFMSPGVIDEETYLYPYQAPVQIALLCIILIAVPWLLIPKGVILASIMFIKKRRAPSDHQLLEVPIDTDEEDDESLSAILVHQLIHTIEYCLGCISHTASYLRLWALSLAHGELSEVFFSQVLARTFGAKYFIVKVILAPITYLVWALASFLVLCLMEAMSAFLHALRLHWVEHQSKFFVGEGYPFEPLAFDAGQPLEKAVKEARAAMAAANE